MEAEGVQESLLNKAEMTHWNEKKRRELLDGDVYGDAIFLDGGDVWKESVIACTSCSVLFLRHEAIKKVCLVVDASQFPCT